MQKKTPSSLTVEQDHPGQRLDNFLFCHLSHIPKTRIYRAIRSGEVRVNKKRYKANTKLVPGDVVRVPPPFQYGATEKKVISQPMAQKIENHIIFEDDKLLVLDKPEGLAVHGGSGLSFGVIELLRASRPDSHTLELGHRIDKLTSGCLIVVKKRSALRQLHAQFASGKVKKEYLAIVHGNWPEGLNKIDLPLLRKDLPSGDRRAVIDSEKGKPSISMCHVLKQQSRACLVRVRPKTGRLHQIRAHCHAVGHPIVNDPKYTQNGSRPLVGGRMGLHAKSLKFSLDDKDYFIEAEPQQAFWDLLLERE